MTSGHPAVDFIQVPFFPVQNDVVVVNLCDGESIAVVLSVNESGKNVKIKYMVKAEHSSVLKTMQGRSSTDTIAWDTILKGKRTSKKSINFFLKFQKNNLKLAI